MRRGFLEASFPCAGLEPDCQDAWACVQTSTAWFFLSGAQESCGRAGHAVVERVGGAQGALSSVFAASFVGCLQPIVLLLLSLLHEEVWGGGGGRGGPARA